MRVAPFTSVTLVCARIFPAIWLPTNQNRRRASPTRHWTPQDGFTALMNVTLLAAVVSVLPIWKTAVPPQGCQSVERQHSVSVRRTMRSSRCRG